MSRSGVKILAIAAASPAWMSMTSGTGEQTVTGNQHLSELYKWINFSWRIPISLFFPA